MPFPAAEATVALFPSAEATVALFPSARLTKQAAPDHIPSEETLGELFAELRAANR